MTVPSPATYLPDAVVIPFPEFRLGADEPLGEGLKRLCLTEIERAVSGFYDGEEAFGLAVHEARKTTKRLRALLRLVRSEIGERAYRYENAAMRETARLLSPVRTAAVVVEGVLDIRQTYGALLAEGTFEELEERLTIGRNRAEQRVMEDPGLVPRVVENLEKAHGRYASWPTHPDARSMYGVGIRDDFDAFGPGLLHTYRRGRREMVSAYKTGTPMSFHAWRKRAKYLRHQLEILSPLWPEMVLGMALTLQRVADLLGEDHDLAELIRLVSNRIDLCPNPIERSLLTALAEQRRTDLETACRVLGRRVYAESPEALTSRFSAYWDSVGLARSAGPISISL